MEKYGLVRAGWPVLAFVVLGIAGCSKGPEHSATELHFDLRGQPLPAAFRTFGRMSNEDIRPEPDGLRIALPKDRPGQFMGGLDLVTNLTGDCEITAAVEIIEAERPNTDEPSRVGVFLAANQAARVGQLMEMSQSDMVWERFTAPDGTKAYIGGGEPSSEKLRRLRLRRTRGTLCRNCLPPTSSNGCSTGSDITWRSPSQPAPPARVRPPEDLEPDPLQPCARSGRHPDRI